MIETGAFIAGVGVLVGLDLAVLGISVQNARQIGTDKRARERAAQAHERINKHHGGDGA